MMTFLRTVFSVCSGVSAMPELMKRSPWRALLHLAVMCAVLAFAASTARCFLIDGRIGFCLSQLQEYFGGINVSFKGILPENNPDVPRVFILTKQMRLDYLTAGSLKSLDRFGDWEQQYGIFWTPGGFYFWMRPDGDPESCLLFELPCPQAFNLKIGDSAGPFGTPVYQRVRAENLRTELHRLGFSRLRYPGYSSGASITFAELEPEILFALWAMFFFSLAFGMFLLSLMTVFIFAGAQQLWRPKGQDKPTFANTLTIMLYSTFPALIISLIFWTFMLPFPGFQTVFFIVFFIYHLAAFRKVRRTLYPPPPPDPRRDDDSDDFY